MNDDRQTQYFRYEYEGHRRKDVALPELPFVPKLFVDLYMETFKS